MIYSDAKCEKEIHFPAFATDSFAWFVFQISFYESLVVSKLPGSCLFSKFLEVLGVADCSVIITASF